jgi:hypothetical protein
VPVHDVIEVTIVELEPHAIACAIR